MPLKKIGTRVPPPVVAKIQLTNLYDVDAVGLTLLKTFLAVDLHQVKQAIENTCWINTKRFLQIINRRRLTNCEDFKQRITCHKCIRQQAHIFDLFR